MRMDEMNKLFEEQGFEVKREWNHVTDCYEFTIRKDDNFLHALYKYPVHVEKVKANTDQIEFVRRTIRQFEERFGPKGFKFDRYFVGKMKNAAARRGWDLEIRYEDEFNPMRVILFVHDRAIDEHCCYTMYIDWINTPRANIEDRAYESLQQLFKNMEYSCQKKLELRSYLIQDYHSSKAVLKKRINSVFGSNRKLNANIKDVIFNPPATIVMWDDGTKTVVKCQDGDEYDPEKGLAMAISKKALGNDRKYYHTFLHWLKKYEKQNVTAEQEMKFDIKLPSLSEASANIHKLQRAIYEKFGMAKSGKVEKKQDAVQKAYDLLVKFRDTSDVVSVDEVIGYLGEALEG